MSKPPKIAKWSIPPTAEQIAAYDGMHCASKWRRVGPDWRCPCCSRRRDELIRWAPISGTHFRAKYGDAHGMAWTASIVEHHCHGTGRFPRTIICGDCNSADGAVKRKLGLPKEWSFSPKEIAQFVSCFPHSGHTHLDYDVAREIAAEHGQF